MRKRLVVYGLLAVAMVIALSVERRAYRVDRTETEMVIIVNPRNPLNPVVKNPYQEEYERMLYPTVRITAGYSTGSGVIFTTKSTKDTKELSRDRESEEIYILTACHVVEDETIVNIEFYNSETITGTVVITDTVKDLAFIRVISGIRDIRVKDIYSAQLVPRDYTPYLFTPVWTVGCSLGLEPRPSYGHITNIADSTLNAIRSTLYFEVSAPILPGNSGGPVFDGRTYEVIGIAVWVKVYDGQLVTTMAGVVPINQIYEFLDSHRDTEVAEK